MRGGGVGPEGAFPDWDVLFHAVDELGHGGEALGAVGALDDEDEGGFADVDGASAVEGGDGGEGVTVCGFECEGEELAFGHGVVGLVVEGDEIVELVLEVGAGLTFSNDAMEAE